MNIDHDKITDILREVAVAKIEPRFQKLTQGDIREKDGPNDLVTIADEEAEIELTKRLMDFLPGSLVLGEEAVAQGTVSRDILRQNDSPVWIVDPVDGTRNFTQGIPKFGTILALVHKGDCVAGWIYQIPAGRMISAARGEGVQINGARYVAAHAIPAKADFSTMRAFVSTAFLPLPMRSALERKIALLGDGTPYMCCAWEYPAVLEGVAAFSMYGRIEPWDHVAGALILEEAGLCVRKHDGSPYRAGDLTGGLINAASPALWDRVFETFLRDEAAL